ncbi:MAG: rod shape-determining protein MreD [Muribaculaceae bacterium]|nr:rod shape-determining protein MreD [Muribaculaceae bacterium]
MLIILILVQVLICNHIHIFNVAMPFVYIYVIIRLPMNFSTNRLLTWAFLSGFIVDLFSDTPGVNSLACTLIAFAKRNILYLYIPKDDRTRDIQPSIANLGFTVYAKYILTLSLIFCFLIFTIEYFNFADVKEIVIMSLSSGLLTFALLLGIDSLMVTKRD